MLFMNNQATNFEMTGMAFNIRCIPDLFTGESFNIGACVIASNGSRTGRVIEDGGRLACLFGEDAAKGIVFLAESALCDALEGKAPSSPNIIFDEPVPIYNIDPLEAVDNIFVSQVTAAIPMRTRHNERLPQIQNNKVIQKVHNQLKLIDFHAANEIIPSQIQTVVKTRKGTKAIQIPLTPQHAGGIIQSATYTPKTVKEHLLNSWLDLELASEAKNLHRLGIFILRPTDWPEYKLKENDDAIDSVIDRVPSRVRVEVEDNIEKLTESIFEWSKAA